MTGLDGDSGARAIFSVIVLCTIPLARARRRRPAAPKASESWRRRTDQRLRRRRRVATSPGSSAPTPAIRPRASRTSSIARTWPRDRRASRSPSTCRPRPGFDSDHILARGEVGKVGVAISHIGDMRALFEDIPARVDEHVDDHQRHRAVADGALYRRRRRAGRAPQPASGHDPERHHQGISGPRRPTSSRPTPRSG